MALYTTNIRNILASDTLPYLVAETPSGIPLEAIVQNQPSTVARSRILIDWEQLAGLDQFILRDKGASYSLTIDLPPTMNLSEAALAVASVKGGIGKTRLRGPGDMSPLFFHLVDAQGQIMQPELELITLETEGVEINRAPMNFSSTYTLWAGLISEPGLGPGVVRFLGNDGRVLGEFPVDRIPIGGAEVDMGISSATLEELPLPHLEDQTHEVRIMPRGRDGELQGMNVELEVLPTGAEIVVQPYVNMLGEVVAMLRASPTATEIQVEVWLEGELLSALSAPWIPSSPAETGVPQADATDLSLDASLDASPGSPGVDLDPGPSAKQDSGGCRAGSHGGADPGALWSLLALAWLALRRTRRELRA